MAIDEGQETGNSAIECRVAKLEIQMHDMIKSLERLLDVLDVVVEEDKGQDREGYTDIQDRESYSD